MGISIFAKPSFLGIHYPKIVQKPSILRLSGEIRGKQVADYIGAKFNPTQDFEQDLCIFVKGFMMDKAKDGDYVDFSDAKFDELAPKLRERPKINVIAHSQYAYDFIRKGIPNKVVCIPQQHINWENEGRQKNDTLVGGYIGRPSNISVQIQNEIRDTLKQIGIEFIIAFEWSSRQDAIDFYKKIDFLVLGGYGLLDANLWQITPTKMINAASFGVPSIAFMRVGYKEFEGYYMQFKTMADLIIEVQKIKNNTFYYAYSEKIKEKANEYSIDKIAKLYKGLCS